MSTLRLLIKLLAYEDYAVTSNPTQNYLNWAKDFEETVTEPGGQVYEIGVGDSLTVFNGTRTTTIGANTEFTLTLSPLSSTRYRFTNTAGTAAGLRTNRNLTPNGTTITVVVNANQTATFTSSSGTGFSGVQVGDSVFIPGVVTGDTAGPFDVLNQGFWVVLSLTGTNIMTVARRDGETFTAYGEVASVTGNSQFIAFSSSGVQVGDSVDISSGFSTAVLKGYTVEEVTPTWFEVIETSALPVNVSGIPTSSGIAFYSNGKRLVFVDANQECSVRANGASDDTQRITPWTGNDNRKTGPYLKVGLIWQLVIVNKSSNILKVFVATVE